MAYLGNTPGVSSQRLVSSFTATAGQTSFTPSGGYMLGYVDVLVNGVELLDGADFTAADGVNVVLTAACAAGDEVKVKAWLPRGLSDGYTKSEADARYEPLDSAYTKAESDAKYPTKANNLSDLASASTARTNLGLGTLSTVSPTGTANTTTFLRGDNSWQVVAVTPTAVSDQNNTSTGYFDLPAGTTAQRPASPANGMTRFNTTLGYPEWYSETYSTWVPFYDAGPYSVEYLVVAGGGGGGGNRGGGGGAGGYISGSTTVFLGTAYSLVVGGGGAGMTSGNNSAQGSNSTGFSQTAIGGGRGGGNMFGGGSFNAGGSGGSGGGGGSSQGTSGGSGTSGQGFAGGSNPGFDAGGGGGGASASGSNGSTSPASGGAGTTWLNGTTYATGGTGFPGPDFSGGGGSGTANTGNGAQGGSGNVNGGTGGSGVVIVRYLGGPRGAGGTVTSAGGYTYHTFTSSGTFTA